MVKKQNAGDFAERLLRAFREADVAHNKSEIVKKLGLGGSAFTAWTKVESGEGNYPTVENLLKISALTKCNLQWLLTGEGESGANRFNFLAANERQMLERIAEAEGRKIEQVIVGLVLEALAQRAAEVFTHLNRTGRISEDERQQLLVLYDLVAVKSKIA